MLFAIAAHAQTRPYIGYVYPAGGQEGTTFQIRLGGQGLDDVNAVLATGSGVTAKVIEYHRRLNNQELQLLNEQLRTLKRGGANDAAKLKLIAKIENRTRGFVQTPACASISSLVLAEVTLAPDAEPGEREVRLVTLRGVSNPLAFHVGQVKEYARKPMLTATIQVLGKEAQSLRQRPTDEVEARVTLPCTVNGQIASGEVNRYRFAARKGQRLVISTQARQLIPYIADAVPGWFQPVLVLYDADGREVAYDDDYRFKPDPTILHEVTRDGEYALEIHDSIYRGREDFVYRVTMGELPFVTSVFPLGGPPGALPEIKMQGWNLQEAKLIPPANDDPGIQWLVARRGEFVSNRFPFERDTRPEGFEKESNNDPKHAQKLNLPIIVNGRMDQPNDEDVFRFTGKANDVVVAEVSARRLDSPLDSIIKLTDEQGAVLAYNDDYEDLCAGLHTHHADSHLMAKLPADGSYFVHIGDTARKGGEEYGYRLRISAPQPDFALRVVPSSISLRGKSSATLNVYAMRKDGFTGPIKIGLQNPPAGFSSPGVTLSGTQTVARLTFKTDLVATKGPVRLSVVGRAKIGPLELTREAVAAEDRMQAFLWRQLVPASDLQVLVFDPSYNPPPKRVARARPSAPPNQAAATTNATLASTSSKPQFSKQQVAGRLRQLKLLFEEDLLTDDFYNEKVAECEAVQ